MVAVGKAAHVLEIVKFCVWHADNGMLRGCFCWCRQRVLEGAALSDAVKTRTVSLLVLSHLSQGWIYRRIESANSIVRNNFILLSHYHPDQKFVVVVGIRNRSTYNAETCAPVYVHSGVGAQKLHSW